MNAALRGCLAFGAAAVLVTGLSGGARAEAAPALQRLKDTQLDARAIYFVSFDGVVNNNSFQQNGILTYAGYQYAAWYTADRSAMIARRHLPNGTWKPITLPHTLSADDSHNVISMGVSPQDGRLHVAMDTHGDPVYYTKSEPGLASSPSPSRWSASRFEPIERSLDGVDLGSITYPRFLVTPERRLQFVYRTGGSGNGTKEIAEYDAASGWTKLGKWSSAAGTYSGNGQTSNARNMYIHGITYGPDGRLHAAFTWREQNFGVLCHTGGLSNHDTGYVYSDDRGRTWRNNAGQPVATTGSEDLVALDDPGLVVDPLDPNHALMNQESQAVDSAGNPHVIISYVPGRFTQCITDFTAQRARYSRAFHLTRDPSSGAWRKVEIPTPNEAFGRSRIVFDRADNAYVIMPFGRIVAASKASGWSDWRLLFDGTNFGGRTLNVFGEVLVDDTRVPVDGVLSVFYQQKSTGTTPSPIRVIDFKLG